MKLNTDDFQRGAFTEDDAARVVALLADEGVDLLELSGGSYERGASFGEGVVKTDREALLSGLRASRATSRVTPPRFLFESLSAVAEMSWYGRQLARMGEGLEHDAGLSLGWSLVLRLAADFFGARRLRVAYTQRASLAPRSVSAHPTLEHAARPVRDAGDDASAAS